MVCTPDQTIDSAEISSGDDENKRQDASQTSKKRKMPPDNTTTTATSSSLSWISKALESVHDADLHITGLDELHAHPSPNSLLPELRKVRTAAMALLDHTNDAMLYAKTRHCFLEKRALEKKVLELREQLSRANRIPEELLWRQMAMLEESRAETNHNYNLLQYATAESAKQAALLQQARAESAQHLARLGLERAVSRNQAALLRAAQTEAKKQSSLFQKEKEALIAAHKSDQEALIEQAAKDQKALQRRLEEESERSICLACQDKPRDTVTLPCLHFQYCFTCLLRHRENNSNTCPTCRTPIKALSMSSYLNTQ